MDAKKTNKWSWIYAPSETKMPIVVQVPAGTSAISVKSRNGSVYQFPVVKVGGVYQSEFSLAVAGNYTLIVGQESSAFSIKEHQQLGMGEEFGLTAFLVIIGFSLVIAWTVRKKRQERFVSAP